ncbi:phosphate-starvation-inducible PsiE family protein [Candidatus Agathobaculum pullicola]|uniref:phosphate-starvation-inducible PsiE family protein n=1 Tax=Candidatus Agathobaculum pullicola TaxID=2838426 RepID=UPI003F903644
MDSNLRDKISSAATAIELTLGLIILLACVIGSVGLVYTTELNQLFLVPDYLQKRLSDACLIIIGIELIKMITCHTIDSVVDVMLLAIARQMIVEHTTPVENMLAVLSVGVLFVIRKYLYISRLDRRKRSKKDIESDVQAEVLGFDVSKENREKQGRS